jgi:hypothetical protein
MPCPRRFLLCTVLGLVAALGFAGCGPTAEERKILDMLNQQPEIVERGGRVESFEIRERRPRGGDDAAREERREDRRAEGGFYGFEAEIVDANGVAIGRLRSQRVEGFGTMKPRIKWYEKPGVPEDW